MYTGVEVFLMWKVLYIFCFEIWFSEGWRRKWKKGKFENKTHKTFDIRNTSDLVSSNVQTPLLVDSVGYC